KSCLTAAGARQCECRAGPEHAGENVQREDNDEGRPHGIRPSLGSTIRYGIRVTRAYNSPGRSHAAAKTRARIVSAAAAILGTAEGISGFSLQAVAKKAGVTRLTVYNQFGSRRALLEAVFDDMAVRGGLHRIPSIMAGADPQAGLLEVISIFCDFWSFGS